MRTSLRVAGSWALGLLLGVGALLAGACGEKAPPGAPQHGVPSHPWPPAALYDDASAACAAYPLRQTGVVHYFCDCQDGAQAGCVAGDDANEGTDPSAPKQTFLAAVAAFNAMNGGDTVAFCKGGAWTASAAAWLHNQRCAAVDDLRLVVNTSTCDLRDYAPGWGGSAKPIIRQTATADLLQFWNATQAGIRILNLELEGGGSGPGGVDLGQRAIALGDGNSDVMICNDTIHGWYHAIHLNGTNGISDIDVLGNRITMNSTEGILGAGSHTKYDSNLFDTNGGAHTIYAAGQGLTDFAIVNNLILRTGGPACTGTILVVHDSFDGLVIENNVVDGGTNPVGGCFAIQVDDGGYPRPCYYRNLTIRRNLIKNFGTAGISMAAAPGAVIENNVVVANQPYTWAIVAPEHAHRTSPLDDVMNGVVIRNNTLYFPSANGWGISVGSEGTGHVVANNAIVFAGGGANSCLNLTLPLSAFAYVDHNLCDGFTKWEATQGSLDAWRAYSGGALDAASLATAPEFVGPPDDFTPAVGSPLSGAGDAAQAPKVDFGLRARPSPPSIGAYER